MLAILASPRKNGNVAKMLNLAVKEAENHGYDTELINLYEKNISYCKGCMACKKTGICVIDDDISAIRQRLILCDLAVIACPTYFANVTDPLKNMFDRLVATLMDDNGGAIPKPKLLKSQKYILLTTCNTPAPLNRLGGQSTGYPYHCAGLWAAAPESYKKHIQTSKPQLGFIHLTFMNMDAPCEF